MTCRVCKTLFLPILALSIAVLAWLLLTPKPREPSPASVPTEVSGKTNYGSLVNTEMVPAGWKLPENVINTSVIPEFSLSKQDKDDMPLPVYQLTDNTYFLLATINVLSEANRGFVGNAGFVVTREGVVVIDTLGTPKLARRMIATIATITTQPIRYVIVTHNHPDHAYGGASFMVLPDVTIIAHAGTQAYNNTDTLERSVAYRREMLPDDMAGFKPLQARQYVNDETFSRYRFKLGDSTFDVYNTGQHHSHGDLVVHQVEDNVLWISDLAFNQRTTFMGDGHSAQILKAQDWMMKQFPDVKLMIPGHGGPQTAPFPMVSKTHDYVQRLRDSMKQAVDEGVSLYDAVQNAEFDDWKNVRLYKESHPPNANFVYREMEQEFFGE